MQLRRLINTFLPATCLCCHGRLLSSEQYICSECLASWPHPSLSNDPHDNHLARLFWGIFPIEGAAAAFSYVPGEIMSRPIHNMKYRNKPNLCRMMGRLIAIDELAAQLLEHVDILIPVPLTPKRKRERHYNQSELICQGISEITGIPVVTNALERIRFDGSQTALTTEERKENIRNAFRLGDTSQIEGKSIAIVDDIITSGATIIECLTILRDVPNIRITVLSLGKTRSV